MDSEDVIELDIYGLWMLLNCAIIRVTEPLLPQKEWLQFHVTSTCVLYSMFSLDESFVKHNFENKVVF